MASRNIQNKLTSSAADYDSSDDEEITRINLSGAKPKPPKINYGDRMPFRQGICTFNTNAWILFNRLSYIAQAIQSTSQ